MKRGIALVLSLCMMMGLLACREAPRTEKEDGAGENVVTESAYQAFEKKKKEQSIYTVSDGYVKQVGGHDLLEATVQNQSGGEIKSLYVAFAAWDEEGQPICLKSATGATDDSYIKIVFCENLQLADGALWDDGYGYAVSEECQHIAFVESFALAYEAKDGTYWENPLYDTWREMYEGVALRDFMMAAEEPTGTTQSAA